MKPGTLDEQIEQVRGDVSAWAAAAVVFGGIPDGDVSDAAGGAVSAARAARERLQELEAARDRGETSPLPEPADDERER